ncbi:MAG: hypothetical protein PHX60_15680 [Giesbergeria sp.]|uniref:hypothetical protein n=1 Tax=Giesbergeria sp. TaxID=2818473 RepID=UPI002615A7AF|nr:hypothetical protein [Giesbergeria sp.]MDD2611092.1 hypothetical protein [Giesbergeria sp.]
MKKRYTSIVGSVLCLLSLQSMAEVKYEGLEVGDNLYTRGSSEDCRSAWVNRFKVTSIKDGVAWGTSEQAKVSVADIYFRALEFKSTSEGSNTDLTKVCKVGGCYTLEEEPFAEVKYWMVFGCPPKK